jgi:hypothetical protein
MALNPVRFDFYKKFIIYTSVFRGNAYASLHNREGMSDDAAKKAFHREHNKEVATLYEQHGKKNQSTAHH